MGLTTSENNWSTQVIKRDEIDRYLRNGRDFIDDNLLEHTLKTTRKPDVGRVHDILAKSLSIQTLSLDETATLLNVQNEALWHEMEEVAAKVKQKVYDNRIVTFAPLYCSDVCVNNCVYCGFRSSNTSMKRRVLTMAEIRKEAEVLAGTIGHKRLMMVYGEHPVSSAEYIADSIKTVYSVKVPTRHGWGEIRRVNVNAAPMSIADLRMLHEVGIGTFQVFQETYHHATYARVHPANTVKGDYQWRVTSMHRALDAGIDDVGIGVLFGLYDWRFEVLGLLAHTHELEDRFGIGPHTISFPRLKPAEGTPFIQETRYALSDADYKKALCVLRLSVPYTGMICTARESDEVMRSVIPMCTQRDASTCLDIGGYAEQLKSQQADRQQFLLDDTRSLDTVVHELADMGYITSFCTAGYRCGRTGKRIMTLLKSGCEGRFCKLNAVLTFREWLDDFASESTKQAGEKIIERELGQIRQQYPAETLTQLDTYYREIQHGQRDLYF